MVRPASWPCSIDEQFFSCLSGAYVHTVISYDNTLTRYERMKAPKLVDLADIKPEDKLTQAVASEKARASTVIRKTHTFEQRHLDHIHQEVLALTNEMGRAVNASEALRAIIERDMEAKR